MRFLSYILDGISKKSPLNKEITILGRDHNCDIGINNDDPLALPGQCQGKIPGQVGLPDASFAAGHCHHLGIRVFFVIGFFILSTVDEQAGKTAAGK